MIIDELLKITLVDDEFYNRRNARVSCSNFVKTTHKKDLSII